MNEKRQHADTYDMYNELNFVIYKESYYNQSLFSKS